MRRPTERVEVNPKTGRSHTVYCGSIRFRGKQYWVPGKFRTALAWERAADELKQQIILADAKAGQATAEAAHPTLTQFAGAQQRGGRLLTAWPRSHPKRRRRKESSIQRAQEGIRPLIRCFGDRRAGEISPAEAYEFLREQGMNTRQYSAQFYDDLLRLHPIPEHNNPFRGHDLPPRSPRKQDPEFRVLSDEEFERLIGSAESAREDDYRLIQAAAVIAMGTFCGRPSELFALRYERQPRLRNGVQPAWVDFNENLIHISSQIGPRGVEEVLPKDNEERVVVLPPPMREAILRAPRISDYVFPAVRGGRLTTGLWDSHYWPAIRALFGDPRLEFYELKHRAITWCCTPVESGGLGLDPATVALQAGHNDGGLTIAKHYLKLDQRLAQERVMRAMAAHAAAQAALAKPSLRVIER